MRILTFTRLIGIAAIGGAVYVHKQRGGNWTLASMQDTLQYLLSKAANKLGEMNQAAGQRTDDTRHGQSAGQPMSGQRNQRLTEEARPRPYGETTKRDDTSRH